jgi:hypothetical protein
MARSKRISMLISRAARRAVPISGESLGPESCGLRESGDLGRRAAGTERRCAPSPSSTGLSCDRWMRHTRP